MINKKNILNITNERGRGVFVIICLLLCITACNRSSSDPKNQIKISQEDSTYTGDYITYHPNKQIKLEGQVYNGKRVQLWKSYFENGNIWSETNYASGQRHGKTISYYPSGIKRYVGQYSKGEKSGIWIFFAKDGSVQKEEQF